ncbi:MAG: hypothetical protein M3Z54_12960 [Gemmatimonadota bacterium]|nr:hypothetical protein [Gemmatimonadota bacterium]
MQWSVLPRKDLELQMSELCDALANGVESAITPNRESCVQTGTKHFSQRI